MSEQPDRRTQLGSFLRSRRERLTPDEVGLPRTGRRRTPGLRREELALLAGMSATWYTYLEQGRDIRPSEQVLNALAAALRLDAHERDHLFHLAGHGPATPGPEEPEALTREAAAVPHLLQPNPAYVIAGNYDVLSHNQAAEELFPGLVDDTGRPPNFVRWVFLEPVARSVVIDWEPEARGLLARLRTLSTRHPDDPRYTRLVRELHEGSPEVRAWWPQYDIQPRHSGRKRLHHPLHGPTEYAYTAFHLAEAPEQTLVVYADSSTTESLERPTAHHTRRR
ncbi:transcriptional regulator with XRE-family HTH domain [Streptomyces sp. SAI-144]|uniref:helix-turn-helix transcriptional regulator n=1 Tax=unclassified Streptomyces TaxID=2593676 RepID=UPI0024766856|nr:MULTISPECIES: helix-turn-helix transcriptional regulator [unclassified Streptomyces]MDH6440399.1 transcriptional regulator with XRE-family HTH domain [Streptomyces sp. SAI-144]MDH6487699.1 transcriptional regulator with XRE-family HTH domain [Streptomyces sp. SAI-127]